MAAAFSLGINLLIRWAGHAGIVYWGPIFEELLKTGFALFFNTSVPGTHILFGVLEAAGECLWGKNMRVPALLSGIAAHSVFGLITFYIIKSGYNVIVAVTIAAAVHILWNGAVLKISGAKTSGKV